jgi:hypothetical protein
MKDNDNPFLALLGLGGLLFLWGCAVAVFLGAGYVWVKIGLPVAIFLGAFLFGLAAQGPPR